MVETQHNYVQHVKLYGWYVMCMAVNYLQVCEQ